MTASAVGVVDCMSPRQGEGPGANPRTALHEVRVQPVPMSVVKEIVERRHYLHSLPGGTKLAFGVFLGYSLLGAVTLGVGPISAPCLVDGASNDDCLTLTRLCLDDELPPNSESRVIGVVIRGLRRNTSIRFLLSYADPSQGHVGTIYQATGWLYTGMSEPMPRYDLGDGKARHSRSVGHAYGSHNLSYLRDLGVQVHLVPQAGKHRYLYFVDQSWRSRLRAAVLAYPRKEHRREND